METSSIVNIINSKYNSLLIEIENDSINTLTNKINGLIIKIDVEPLSLSSKDYVLIGGQDFFKVENIKQAVTILDSLGFKDKNVEETVKLSFHKTFKNFDDNSPFFLGIYIFEAIKRQREF